MATMRLSEAIRLGAMNKPQCFTGYHQDGATCAMGAAFDAIGVLGTEFVEEDHFPITSMKILACPDCGAPPMCSTLASAIFHLNDDHSWTRERIADWVETLEPAPKADAVGEAVDQPVAVNARG